MKKIQIDDLEIGAQISVRFPGDCETLEGTFLGLIYDLSSDEWFIEIFTPLGFLYEFSTREGAEIFSDPSQFQHLGEVA